MPVSDASSCAGYSTSSTQREQRAVLALAAPRPRPEPRGARCGWRCRRPGRRRARTARAWRPAMPGSAVRSVRPRAGLGADVDGAGERAQARGHHVEADAAAGDLGHHVARGEAGQQRETRDLGVGGRGVGGQQPAFHGLGCGCRARLRPRPSSATCTVTTWPRRATVSVMVPARGLPAASRSSGDSSPWSTALRRMCSSGSINWFSTSASTRMSLAHDHERSLFVSGGGGLAHVALQARHDGLHRRHARLRGEMLQFAHEALLLVQDAGESRELVLESDAQVARVGGFFDQRARERLHFVVLVHFQRVEVGMCALTTLQLVARGDAADVDGMFELVTGASGWRGPLDQFARMAGRGFQFLVELADLDRELAHHAHQVVEQLAWARAWSPWLRRARPRRARLARVRAAAAGASQRALAHRVRRRRCCAPRRAVR